MGRFILFAVVMLATVSIRAAETRVAAPSGPQLADDPKFFTQLPD